MSNVLGRGLDALLSGDDGPQKKEEQPTMEPAERVPVALVSQSRVSEQPKESVFWIETAKIKPNPEQPRTSFDEEKIRGLADSIRQYGILQPIVVSKREIDVPTGTQVEYQIIAGERRYRAASLVGLEHMPAVIRREESDRIKLELALIENLQREDLNPVEKARAYRRLIDDFHLSAREVGLRVGRSREAVANTVRLLLLPDYVLSAVQQGRVSEGQARPLISISHNTEEQRTLFQRVLAESMISRDVERATQEVLGRIGPAVRHLNQSKKAVMDAVTKTYETQLADTLGTRVSVRRSREGKGRISIEFFSDEEFQNLMTRLAVFKKEAEEDNINEGETSASETFTV